MAYTMGSKEEGIILAPLNYLLEIPGKDIRSKMIAAFNEWLQIPEDKLSIIKRIIGLLHTASLLIDDIQDSSRLRRGVPVAHSIFGVAQTINTANYGYFLAQQELPKLGDPRAFAIYTEELLNLHRGQGMDLYWRDALVCPTEDEYITMVLHKTGGLFRLAIRLMMIAAGTDKDYVPLVNTLGVIFQIRDDYLNLQCDAYTKNKGFGEDLTEGKFSFPVIHHVRAAGEKGDRRLLNILKQRTEDADVKRYAIGRIEATGSFEYTRAKIARLMEDAKKAAREIAKGKEGEEEACDAEKCEMGIGRIVGMIGLEA